MENKKGITLLIVVLIITIILILSTIIVVNTTKLIDNSNLISFAEDLDKIEQSTVIYHEENDSFPVLGENRAYSKEEIMNLVPLKGQKFFEEELTLNNDNVNNSNMGSFYKIDLNKIGIENTNRGTKTNAKIKNKESDVYVIAYPSMTVYYLAGEEVDSVYYFSLSTKLGRRVKVENIPEVSFRRLNMKNYVSMHGITIKKNKKNWTNKIDFQIECNLENNESVFISLENGKKHKIPTNTGYNKIMFEKNFNKIINDKNKILTLDIQDAEIIKFNRKPQNEKVVEISKEKNGFIIGNVKVDLSNYETEIPRKISDKKIKSTPKSNILSFKVSDNISGIKEVRYEFLEKYDENLVSNLYYKNVDNYELSYMLTRGKLAKLDELGNVEINLPKDIKKIQIRILDKAGNVSEAINEIVELPININVTSSNATTFDVNLKTCFKTSQIINFAKIQVSTDGNKYTDLVNLNLNKLSDKSYVSNVYYEDAQGIKDKVYVKIVVNYDNNKNEIFEKEIDLKNDVTNLGEGTKNKEIASYKKPFVPDGFTYVEGTVDTGYVIKDERNGNEFVWIPVKNISEFKRGVIADNTNLTGYYENDNLEVNVDLKNSVEKYGGFYIGRYETRYMSENNETTVSDIYTMYKNNKIKPVIKSGYHVITNISFDNAKEIAENMYNSELKSSIFTSYAYDTMLNYIINTGAKSKEEINNNSTSFGNYKNNNISKNDKNYENYTKVNNIYDIAGNASEITTEIFNSSPVIRGGSYLFNGNQRTVSSRNTFEGNSKDCGFRIVLYWK